MGAWIKRSLRKASRPTTTLSWFSIVVAALSGYAIYALFKAGGQSLDPTKFADQVLILGLFALALVLLQRLAQAIYGLTWAEKRIVVDSGPPDYERLLDEKCHEAVFVGQNFRTLLSGSRFKDTVVALVQRGATVRFIGATYDGMKAISRETALHFAETLRDFQDLFGKVGEDAKLYVRFHPSAISLSCLLRDPHVRNRAVVVFTPKWARDADPRNRLQCVIERWEYEGLFNRLIGHLPAMTEADSQTLADICGVIRADVNAFPQGESLTQVLKYFIDRPSLGAGRA